MEKPPEGSTTGLILSLLRDVSQDIKVMQTSMRTNDQRISSELSQLRVDSAARDQVVKHNSEELKSLSQTIKDLECKLPDKLAERIEATEKILPWVKGLSWAAGLLGASIIALIWALITGQAHLMF